MTALLRTVVLDFTNTTATTQLYDGDAPVRYAILLDNGKAQVSNLTIRGPIHGGIGVRVIGGAPTLSGLSIEIKDPAAAPDESMPIGFFGGAAGTVSDSVLSGYIPVRGGSPQFLDNTITGSFSIDGPGAPVLRGNHFLKDSGVGMSFGGSPLIEDNEFDDGGIGVDTGSDPIDPREHDPQRLSWLQRRRVRCDLCQPVRREPARRRSGRSRRVARGYGRDQRGHRGQRDRQRTGRDLGRGRRRHAHHQPQHHPR